MSITEFVERGSLEEALHGPGALNLVMEQRWRMLLDIAEAMNFLHESGIIHRDVGE